MNLAEKFVERVDEHGAVSWAKFQVCRGLGRDTVLASATRHVQMGHRIVLQDPPPHLGRYNVNARNGHKAFMSHQHETSQLDVWAKKAPMLHKHRPSALYVHGQGK